MGRGSHDVTLNHPQQHKYGIRPNHSTEIACTFLTNHTKQIDNKETLINIYLELLNAFDSLDHAGYSIV